GAAVFDAVAGPLFAAAGYPGALGPPAEASPPAIVPLRIAADTQLECDVCVVGSGAGGGTAAAVLAGAGLDVVVLEAGEHYEDGDFDGDERTGLARLYVEGGAAATHDKSVGLLAGRCLGGTTVVNYSTSFRTPDAVREEWAGHGVPAFAGDVYGRSLDAVCERLGVNRDHNRVSHREEL